MIYHLVRLHNTKHRESILFFYINSWRITAKITKMGQIELSKRTLIKLIHHLKSVPLLYSNMMATLHRINLYCKSPFFFYDNKILYAFSSYHFSTSYNRGSWSFSSKVLSSIYAISYINYDRYEIFFFSLIDYFCLIFKTFIVIYRKQGMKKILQFYWII